VPLLLLGEDITAYLFGASGSDYRSMLGVEEERRVFRVGSRVERDPGGDKRAVEGVGARPLCFRRVDRVASAEQRTQRL
jgi:hypothetical protein